MPKFFLLILFTFIFTVVAAQTDSVRFVTVIPGDHYQAGPLKRFLLGEHWRDLWSTPIRVEELDLSRFAGGLTPIERGGGFQTRSLRFKGNDGKEYKFRSLDKDPSRLLPQELADTFVEDVVQDQISWTHPYSAVIAVPFMEETGILQAPPHLVILPDSDLLGKFRKDFGGLLGTLEENPDDKNGTVFAGADKIKSTYNLFKELENDNDESVDASEYLKARLIDIFLGDWDRHVDQWKWAGFRNGRKRIWKPIPRDRDQALAKIDGVIPWGITYAIKQIESYETVFPLIDDMTWSGRHLDRKFLSALTRTEWDSVTRYVVQRLTDSLISRAVHLMPAAMYEWEGAHIESVLRQRRDRLAEASEDFYALSAQYVDIHCSNKEEFAEIVRIDDERVGVTIWKRDKESGRGKGTPIYRRLFLTGETDEIRLYVKDGDDVVTVSGTVERSIDIHIDAGEGKDEIVDESTVNGYVLSTIPIPSAEIKTIVYDSGKKTGVKKGSSTVHYTREFDRPESDTALYEPYRDYGFDFRPLGVAAYNSADGIVIGGGQTLYGYRMKYDPYYFKMDLSAAYATGHNAFRIDFHSILRTYDKNLVFIFDVRLSGIEILRYYGIGNEFPLIKIPENEEYYEVQQGQYIAHPQIRYRFSGKNSFLAGFLIKHSDIQLNDSTFIKRQMPYGASDMTVANIHGGIELDSRDHTTFPTSGAYIRSAAYFFPKVMSNASAFTKVQADARWYRSVALFSPTTLAARLFGETIFGTYPFYEASYLGGTESVRGFEKQRFGGDASVTVHGEVRFSIGTMKVLLPVTFGGTLFAETGRIFVKGEHSTLWHSGAGAGLWGYVVDKELTFSISAAKSHEEIEGHFTTGFTF